MQILTYYYVAEKGGGFAVWEPPAIVAAELRAACHPVTERSAP
jgi:hypothetical protein